MSIDTVCRGYGMTGIVWHPEIARQANELAYELIAYGLVPMEAKDAAARSDSTVDMGKKLPQGPPAADISFGGSQVGLHFAVADDVNTPWPTCWWLSGPSGPALAARL
jgi:hypothetical protein